MTVLVTQSTNSTATIDFTDDNEILTILPNVLILTADPNFGVDSQKHYNASLVNNGWISSNYFMTVFLSGINNSLTNAVGSGVFGIQTAIGIGGIGNQSVNNAGEIAGGGSGLLLGQSSLSVTIHNSGYIFGKFVGIGNESVFDGGTIVNSGTIKSDGYGINIVFKPTLPGHITNTAGGIISGSIAAILVGSGVFDIHNNGKLVGDIVDNGNGFDVVINRGIIHGAVHLGGGNDNFNGNGGTSGPVFGDAGNDHLAAGATADRLHGGDNNDVLTGRLGADRFLFDTALNAVSNVDRITDFSPAQHDKTVLSETYFPHLGAHGVLGPGHIHVGAPVNAIAQIDYHPGNGFLFYDQDGNRSTYAPIHFATLGLATHPVIHNSDFIVIA